jgi:hypothetical protein
MLKIMDFKQLYIFVEGPDDERFMNRIILPLLTEKYNHIKIIKYAVLQPQVVINFVRTFKKQSNSDYLFFSDMDARGDVKYCITKRKEKIISKFSGHLENNKLFIVKEEIESWYLAGISETDAKRFKIKPFYSTDSLTKEDFEQLIPKKSFTPNDFMIEILNEYDFENALLRNRSLQYFAVKQLLNDE